MKTIHNQIVIPENITPELALDLLKEGNFRFINNLNQNKDLLEMVNETKDGQWPFAAIVSCMDSRTCAELVFDQGLGDIFSIRIAGNVITNGILGSLEYATAVAGSKLILVLGHTNCGAITGACNHIEFGNLTELLDHVKPVIELEKVTIENRTGDNKDYVTNVATLNAKYGVQQIVERSPIIKKLVDEGTVGLVPAMYDVGTGRVSFYDNEGIIKDAVSGKNKLERIS